MTPELTYIVRRNVGTVGRPMLACAVCNFSPTGHILTAVPGPDGQAEPDKGLCNIHAQGLGQNATVSASVLDAMRRAWLAEQR
jgi:hypothetical protein